MKCSFTAKIKVLLVIALVVIVAGMVMLGTLGLNKSIDYSESYEMQVSISLSVKDSSEVAKTACNEFFKDNGMKIKEYSNQVAEDGALLIFKSKDDYSDKAQALQTYVDDALNTKAEVKGITSEVKVYGVSTNAYTQTLKISIALAVVAVVVFVYMFFVEKIASALSVVASAVASAILFLSVVSIARIPAYPFIATMVAFAFAYASIISAVIVNRFKGERANVGNDKFTNKETVDIAISKSALRLIFIAVAILVVAVPVGILACGYGLFFALQLLVADVVGLFSALLFTPLVYLSIKKADKK